MAVVLRPTAIPQLLWVALKKLALSAASDVGSAGPVPCFASCPAQREEHQLKPVTYNCLGDLQQSPT